MEGNSPERQQQQSPSAPKRGDISKGAIPKRRTRSEAGKEEEEEAESDVEDDDDNGDSTSVEEEADGAAASDEGLGVVRARFRVDRHNKIVV